MNSMDTLLVGIASDHAGYELKEHLKSFLADKLFGLKDFGTFSEARVDYRDFIHPLAKEVAESQVDFGIAI